MENNNLNKGYLFIANGNKPTPDQAESIEPHTVGTFGIAPIEAASKMGYNIFIGINRNHPEQIKCTNFPQAILYDQHCYRNIFDLKENYRAYKNLCKLLESHPEIEVIHCNTPIGGILGRLGGNKFNKKVIYTVHGFHFYKGAPFINRTVFKWIEEYLARYTNALITINKEDYETSKKMHFKKDGKSYYIPGVGVETNMFDSIIVDKKGKIQELGIPLDSSVGIVVGDLNDNKNVETIIKAFPNTKNDFHLLVCGIGPNTNHLKELSQQLGIENRIHFLGFRKDIKELLSISDLFLFASKREGLSRSIMEAMCAGLPCVVSNIRGNVDLIDDNNGGFVVSPKDVKGFANAINRILSMEPSERKGMGNYNKNKIKKFDINLVKQQMLEIYHEVLAE